MATVNQVITNIPKGWSIRRMESDQVVMSCAKLRLFVTACTPGVEAEQLGKIVTAMVYVPDGEVTRVITWKPSSEYTTISTIESWARRKINEAVKEKVDEK